MCVTTLCTFLCRPLQISNVKWPCNSVLSEERELDLALCYKRVNNQYYYEMRFLISRIIKVEVRVISQSWRLKLITLTDTLIILDITKHESNNYYYCCIINYIEHISGVAGLVNILQNMSINCMTGKSSKQLVYLQVLIHQAFFVFLWCTMIWMILD